ncbi:MAG: prolyl-tRNA synthetase associated domain-containing protein [Eubacteriales bacterium]|nr:prolyl-tRNA synthetase associated domain-containing protein [Eubacteriales bacterium]
MELQNGRPASAEGRLEKEIKVYDFLDKLGVTYGRVDHDAAMTMEACAEVDRVLGTAMCKNLFLCNRQRTDFYLLLTPGEKKFKTKFLSKELGVARLSFGEAEYLEEFMDLTPGSVTVLGLMNDTEKRVQLVIDEDVLQEDAVCCHPCINTSSLRISKEDMMEKIIPAMQHEPIIVRLETE